jgi:ABC-type sugar transport system, permease component
MSRQALLLNLCKHVAIWLVSLTIMVPLLLILLNSVKTQGEAASMSFAWPRKWMLSNYAEVIQAGKLVRSFGNSLYYAVVSVVLGIIVCSMAAFVLSRRRTRLNRFIYYFIVLGIAMPVNHIALIKVMQFLNLMNTGIGLGLLYTALQVPFSVFLITALSLPCRGSWMKRAPSTAAKASGCSSLSSFRCSRRSLQPLCC